MVVAGGCKQNIGVYELGIVKYHMISSNWALVILIKVL